MSVRLRLMRMGKTKQPTYRLVVADQRSPRNGSFIEILGTYDPKADPSLYDVNNDKIVEWLKNGAQPSERVEKLLRISGAWDQFGGPPLQPYPEKTKSIKEAAEKAAEEKAKEPKPEPAAAEETPTAEASPATEEESKAETQPEPPAEPAPPPAEPAPAPEPQEPTDEQPQPVPQPEPEPAPEPEPQPQPQPTAETETTKSEE